MVTILATLSLSEIPAMADKPTWEEKFCLTAKDYAGCIKHHIDKKNSLKSRSPKSHSSKAQSAGVLQTSDSLPKSTSPTGLRSSTSSAQLKSRQDQAEQSSRYNVRRWARSDHDIIVFNPSIEYGPEGLNRNQFIRWSYQIFYFMPGYYSQLTRVPAPSNPSVYLDRYGPVNWTVTADCINQTADWQGDRKDWIKVVPSTPALAEAHSIMKEFCPTISTQKNDHPREGVAKKN